MDSNINDLPNPKRLKTLASKVEFSDGNTLLHQFVLDNSDPNNSGSAGYINAVLLSMSEVSVNALNHEGYTALHLAVLKNNLLMVKKLLSCLVNIDVNTTCNIDKLKNTALHLAVDSGNLSIVQELLNKGAKVNEKNWLKNTALHLAADSGNLSIVRELLNKGAEVNKKNWLGYTALLCAAKSGHLSVIQELLDKGSNPDTKSSFGDTALCFATMSGHLDIMKTLINKGANVNLGGRGEVPLHYAAHSGNLEAVKLLVNTGAYLSSAYINMAKVFQYATLSGNSAIIEFLKQKCSK